jgi:hypothetical protein
MRRNGAAEPVCALAVMAAALGSASAFHAGFAPGNRQSYPHLRPVAATCGLRSQLPGGERPPFAPPAHAKSAPAPAPADVRPGLRQVGIRLICDAGRARGVEPVWQPAGWGA